MKKSNIISHIKLAIIPLFIFLFVGVIQVSAQDKPSRSYMSLSYFKDGDQNKKLVAVLKYKENRKFKMIEGEVILFFALEGEEEVELGIGATNADGEAIFSIHKDRTIPLDTSTNKTIFVARFDGSDQYKASESDVEIKDIQLSLKLEVVDSVKMVYLTAKEVNYDGTLTPIEECDVIFYVPRLYSYLPVEEGYISGGKAAFEFPNDIPGRDNGELSIVAKIEDHDDYGNVEVGEEINWGIPVAFANEEMPTSLFGKAPIWMILAIFFILAGAWYHLFLVLSKLYRIKRLTKI